MLLQQLLAYSERLDLPPTLYSEAVVRYIVDLDAVGRFLGLTDTADPSSPRAKRGLRRLIPQITRSVGIQPLLFADNAEYTFGLGRETSRPERVAACHDAYLALVDDCLRETQDEAVRAVSTFLHATHPAELDAVEVDRGGAMTFRIDDRMIVDIPVVQRFWAMRHAVGEDTRRMQCLVCGNERPVLGRLQGKIKGIPGGQTAGTSIISANAEAFESYGLEASFTAPTCSDCGERFTKAMNALLAGERSSIRIADTVFVFWTRDDVGFDLTSFLRADNESDVRALIESVRTGQHVATIDDTRFYAAALSASGGRAVVRDWIDSTLGEVKARLADWFERQAIVDGWGEEPRPLGLYALAAATVRDARRELAPPVPRSMLRAALTDAPLPSSLLEATVRRCRADQTVTRPQAALIKLVLLSRQPTTERGFMVQLNAEHPSAGYQCGRLLAVLEEVQRAAIPGAKATVVDRFFGTASSAPASVFGRLLRGAQPHLARLDRDRPGAHRALQQRLEEVQAQLRGFPRTLSLEDQGLFALGYYHQRAFDRAQAREAAERRRAGTATSDDDALVAANEAVEAVDSTTAN